MRLDWQCPICFAQIGDKSHARMLTCPFCGTLLIVDSQRKKFYPVKKEKGWHYFPRIYLKGHDGVLRLKNRDLFFKYVNGEWHLHLRNEIYTLVNKEEECRKGEEEDVVGIWGDLPIVVTPEQKVSVGYWKGGLCLKISNESYIFMKIY